MTADYNFRASDLRYGVCVGGPLDGKMLAHHTPVHRLALDPHRPARCLPGVVAGDVSIRFGEYRFQEGKWQWISPDELSSPAPSPQQRSLL